MNIFLTGSTGFIGSHLLERLLVSGHHVKALKRSSTSYPKIQLTLDPQWITKSYDELEASDFDGCSILIHLAAHSANVPYDNLQNCLLWNVVKPLRIFDVARSAGVKNLLLAGSCFEYGLSADAYEYIPADAPLLPTTSYPASKAAASIAATQWSIQNRFNTSICRLFQVYGEGELDSRFWPSLIAAASIGSDFKMTSGEQVRDFIHVKHLCEELEREVIYLTDSKHDSLTYRNIGSGNPCSLLHFAEQVWAEHKAPGKLIPGAYPYRDGEQMRIVPSLERKIFTHST